MFEGLRVEKLAKEYLGKKKKKQKTKNKKPKYDSKGVIRWHEMRFARGEFRLCPV